MERGDMGHTERDNMRHTERGNMRHTERIDPRTGIAALNTGCPMPSHVLLGGVLVTVECQWTSYNYKRNLPVWAPGAALVVGQEMPSEIVDTSILCVTMSK
jgi:hypothetical protein